MVLQRRKKELNWAENWDSEEVKIQTIYIIE